MPLKINITLQIWHTTNTPSEIEKYDTHKNDAFQKWQTLQKHA